MRGMKAAKVWVVRALGSAIACVLCTAPGAEALDPARRTTQYVQTVWRAPRDLPHDNVSAIVQTRDGYLWVGTTEGLARFDGVRSVTFDKGNTPELRNNWIRALHEDRAGRLWIGTFGGGLNLFHDGKFTQFTARDGLLSDNIAKISSDGESLWLSTTRGMVVSDSGNWIAFNPIPEWTGDYARTFAENAGVICITSFDGKVFRAASNRFEELSKPPGIDGSTNPASAGSSFTRAKSLYWHASGSVSPVACIVSHEL
jgi:hypothetical protein